jgi:hypothetical protein
MFFSRGKNKIQNPYTLKDIYCDYIKDKEINSPYYVEYSKFAKMCSMYYKRIAEEILKGREFKLPFSLGIISVIKTKPDLANKKTLAVDWKLTVELKKKIYLLNKHSKYFRYKFYWNKINCKVHNLYYYSFTMSRANKRKLAKIIKAKETDYYEK